METFILYVLVFSVFLASGGIIFSFLNLINNMFPVNRVTIKLTDPQLKDVLNGLEALKDFRCCTRDECNEVNAVIDAIHNQIPDCWFGP